MQTVNPFENDIVSEPRRARRDVSGLNDNAIFDIIERFEKLEESHKLTHAQFVISPQPGYGKSHLIGRIFRELNNSAILVYLKPFEDSSSCWKSILLKIVQELNFPERIDIEYCGDKDMTQLEAFAHGLLKRLIIKFIENFNAPDDKKKILINQLCDANLSELRRDRVWIDILFKKKFKGIVKECTRQLNRNGIVLNASPESWLSVLSIYAYFPDQSELKLSCKDWLQGGSINKTDAEKIGIRLNDIPYPEMSRGEINELCKHRILDFCKLAGFFKPFVFCFDQTENYGKEEMLAKAFGSVIQILTDESENLMTVITANQVAWTNSIKPCWEDAYLARLSEPIELEGLEINQAKELISQRFDGWDLDNTLINNFYKDNWLEQLFENLSEIGVRDFLKRCSILWQEITHHKQETRPITDYYKKAIEEIQSQPRKLVFDPDTLLWLVNEAGRFISDVNSEKYKKSKYLTHVWQIKERRIYFGFEGGSNAKRWESIARAAKLNFEANPKSKAVFFRTYDLPKIPGSNWDTMGPKIEEAKQTCLHIINLEQSDMVRLYAAYDLYIKASEGDIPYKREEALNLIREELKDFWENIQKPLTENTNKKDEDKKLPYSSEKEPIDQLAEEIKNIVQLHKFMSVDECIKMLSKAVSIDTFHKARGHIPEIKVHTGPNITVLQWQSNK
ncbi:MAG: hypothetical protein HQK76_15795 [Desulfobacterales bacterium]|nr:hypothetical protein [Desulfobacterales bacterium]